MLVDWAQEKLSRLRKLQRSLERKLIDYKPGGLINECLRDAGMVILPAYYAAALSSDQEQVIQYFVDICEASPVSRQLVPREGWSDFQQ